MSQTLILIVCVFIAVTDLAVAAYFWLQARKYAASIDTPQAHVAMTTEERIDMEKKIKAGKTLTLAFAANAFFLPIILYVALTQAFSAS